MIKINRPRIYSKYEINSIVFYWTMLLLMPIVLVFTYVFDTFTNNSDVRVYLLILVGVTVLITIIGTIFLLIKRDKLKRMVKATYVQEFYYLVIISIFGILGLVVLYKYLGGRPEYIASILVLSLLLFAYVLLNLGRKYFNLNYGRKK
ncbi:MAG: hypothetical protein PHZ28_00295 [Candidatus Izemoplasmatales bacterium]|nr:hypothetical protein [Candidatus Izemoplasmatales bacterium]